MLKSIGRIVQEARKERGLRPRDLAGDAGMRVDVLLALEAGKSGATTVDVARLAGALELEATALLQGQRVVRPSLSVFFRHAGSSPDFLEEDLPALEGAIGQGRALVALSELLAEPRGHFQIGTFSACKAPNSDAALAGYKLAQQVRRQLGDVGGWLGDLRELVEARFGIAVVVSPLRTARATAIGIKSGHAAAVVLAGHMTERSTARGYIAHELGHILFDPARAGVHIAVDREGTDRRVVASEQRARGFAAELLLPEAGLKELLGQPRMVESPDEAQRIIALARDHFGATWPMTANHLCNREFIDSRLREWLEAISGPSVTPAHVARQRTSLPAVGSPSLLVASYVERAYERTLLTDADARAMLGVADDATLPWEP